MEEERRPEENQEKPEERKPFFEKPAEEPAKREEAPFEEKPVEGPRGEEKPEEAEKVEPEEKEFEEKEEGVEEEKKPEFEEQEEEPKEEELKVSSLAIWQIITAILAILLVVSIFTSGFRFGGEPTAAVIVEPEEEEEPAVVEAEEEPTPAEVQRVEVSADDDPATGPEDAAVTIIEFSDFQCPFCSRGAATMNQILETYEGDVRLVFRDFPLAFHENAQKAAEAGQCAEEQGKFWEYHDLLFENQQALDVANLKGYAAELDLDTEEFNDCLDSGKYEEEVKKDMDDGKAAGVRGTPAFFINGRMVSGAQPFANFKKVIDEELA